MKRIFISAFRVKSLEPFSRHFVGQKFLDLLQVSDSSENPVVTGKLQGICVRNNQFTWTITFSVLPEHTQQVATVLRKYKEAFNQGKLLQLTFTTLSEYLWLLRSACQALAPLENRAVLYLAAAVSDFYIPPNEMVDTSSKFISITVRKNVNRMTRIEPIWFMSVSMRYIII